MAEAPHRDWQDLTTEDFGTLDPERTVAIWPLGAVEQHGPHLPLSTDAVIAEGVAARALELLPEEATLADEASEAGGAGAAGDLRVLRLPLQAVGASSEHGAFPGTLSLAPETLIVAWSELGASLRRAGVRKLVMLNAHGGQPQVVDIVAQRLRLEHAMLAVKVNTFRLGQPSGLFEEDELIHGVHGGALETSLMLHLRPDLVCMDKASDFRPLSRDLEGEYRQLSSRGPAAFAWAVQDLNPAGVCGNAAAAEAGKGRLLLDHLARALAQILLETARFPLERLREQP
ncbi:MAG: creatininase family protein [Rhodospirillales bacterium]|nr:creatininase family protein [Rhodospirillales bacterium]